jgi:Fe-S-cluster-containing hydrogenase component 2
MKKMKKLLIELTRRHPDKLLDLEIIKKRENSFYKANTNCNLCKDCEKICPSSAIIIKNKDISINAELCMQCNLCVNVCKKDAIKC